MHCNINFLGIKVGALTLDEITREILDYAIRGKGRFITYINAHCVNVAFKDDEYKKILQKTDLVYTGGQGVIWAARLLGCPLPERVNILDFFDKLTPRIKEKKITIYLLGGTKEVVKSAQEKLKGFGLEVIGGRDGFFDETEEAEVIRGINILKPDILMVGMGVPKQEKWIYAHLKELDVHLCWAVGAAFDWLSGYRKRAPNWMIKWGLEWLHRLCQQPNRLWKRYLIGNIVFSCHVLKWKITYGKNK